MWDQPPTSGWIGAGQGDIGAGGGHEMEGWAGAGHANMGLDQEEQPGQWGASQNIAN